MARALTCAHGHLPDARATVVHRDLKPSNLLVDPTGIVKVADFGIARVAGSRAGIEGTFGYMSPEQLQGAQVSTATDLYSLGIVAVQLALGRRPLTREEAYDRGRAGAILQARLPEVVALVDDVLPGLGAILGPCLQQEPTVRPTAPDLLADLEGLETRATGASLADLLAELSGAPQASGRPTVALSPRAGNLPPEPDTFVGRGRDLEALDAAFADARLVTLKGIGGLGKTRLAVRWSGQATRPGGTWFCDLSEARTLPGVLHAIATPLGFPLDRGGDADLVRRLGQAVRGRGDALLVLDNTEQVTEAAAIVVRGLLEQAPEVRILVTSREPLLLAGESVVPLSPLEAPEGEALLRSRARGWRPASGEEEEALAGLVARLDGIPLALELAAARLPLLGPARILARLDRDTGLLADRRRDRPARQATLDAVVGWSWDLLDADERAALAALAVFRGGFDLDAAETLLDGGPDAPFALDLLTSLVDRSLVVVRTVDDDPRFSMFEMVRGFAEARLTGDAEMDIRDRHARWFAELASPSVVAAADSPTGKALHDRMLREVDNLLAASDHAAASGDSASAFRTFRAAWWLLSDRGPYGPMAARGEALLQLDLPDEDRIVLLQIVATAQWRLGDVPRALALCTDALALARTRGPDVRASALRMQATMLQASGRTDEALPLLDEALTLARAAGAIGVEGMVLSVRGIARRGMGLRAEALEDFARSHAIAREVGRPSLLARAASNHAMALADVGRLVEAEVGFQVALEHARQMGAPRSEALALTSLATVVAELGRIEEGAALQERARHLHRRLGQRTTEALGLVNLAEMQRQLGRIDEAEASLAEGLDLARQTGARQWEALGVVVQARLYLERGQVSEAVAAAEAAEALYGEVGDRWGIGTAETILGQARLALGDLGGARASLEAALQSHRASGDRMGLATTLCSVASLEIAARDPMAARAALDDARALASELAAVPSSELALRIAVVARTMAGEGA